MAAVNRIAVLRGVNRLVSLARPVAARSSSGGTLAFRCKQVTSISPRAHSGVGPLPQMALRREGVVQLSGCRLYSDDSAMTVSELEDRVLNVLKLFDRINPDKVCCCIKACVYLNHNMVLCLSAGHPHCSLCQ